MSLTSIDDLLSYIQKVHLNSPSKFFDRINVPHETLLHTFIQAINAIIVAASSNLERYHKPIAPRLLLVFPFALTLSLNPSPSTLSPPPPPPFPSPQGLNSKSSPQRPHPRLFSSAHPDSRLPGRHSPFAPSPSPDPGSAFPFAPAGLLWRLVPRSGGDGIWVSTFFFRASERAS